MYCIDLVSPWLCDHTPRSNFPSFTKSLPCSLSYLLDHWKMSYLVLEQGALYFKSKQKILGILIVWKGCFVNTGKDVNSKERFRQFVNNLGKFTFLLILSNVCRLIGGMA
jgi:hypothetical protein